MKPRKRGRKPKGSGNISFVETDELDTICDVCHAEFLDPDDLRVHMAQVHPYTASKGFTCNFCAVTSSSMEHYLLHIRDNHLASLKCCMYCGRGFTDKEELGHHESKHQSEIESKFSCSQCPVLFGNIKALEQHESTQHLHSTEGVILQKYYPLLSTLLCMKAEEFMQSLGDETGFTCRKCKLTTSYVGLYLKHLSEKNCKCISCHKCSRIFLKKSSILKHFNTNPECDEVYPKPMKKVCKECKQTFEFAVYRTHVMMCKNIRCTKCDVTFKTVEELTVHQAEHPNTISLKRCRYCKQELVGTTLFYKHMEKAHGQDYQLYKYNCVICKAYFKHPKNLFGHMFSKHKDVKPYSCKICNKEFHLRKSFTIHIKLKHESKGFVEFDENLNVYFAENKSENPFQPLPNPSLYNEEEEAQRPKDIPTTVEPDINKDIGGTKKVVKKKGPKQIVKKDDETDATATEATETEAAQTEAETDVDKKPTKRLTRKRKAMAAETATEKESSDDEPLLDVKKRINTRRKADKQIVKLNKSKMQNVKNKLTCNVCKKYCFTVQNYHRHVSLHFKTETKQCIKCAKLFTSATKLQEHLKTAHATQHITATLKKLLERRKMNNTINTPKKDKFRLTIKKVDIPKCDIVASLKPANDKNLNVKNFLETFTPEQGADKPAVTITQVKQYTKKKQPAIKMIKFRPTPINHNPKLRMPVKFNRAYNEVVTATVKVHQGPIYKPKLNFGYHVSTIHNSTQDYTEYEDNITQDEDYTEEYGSMQNVSIIPDVAQEVMLENTEYTPKPVLQPIMHTVELPSNHKSFRQGIQIAHLQPQAPYYKIVPFEQVLKESAVKQEQYEDVREEIELPSGTKLVNSNPLAHLMANRQKGEEAGWRKYYKYKPKIDHKTALATAMLKLQEKPPPKKRKPKK